MKWLVCIILWCWAGWWLLIGVIFLGIGHGSIWINNVIFRYANNIGNSGDELSRKKMFKKEQK